MSNTDTEAFKSDLQDMLGDDPKKRCAVQAVGNAFAELVNDEVPPFTAAQSLFIAAMWLSQKKLSPEDKILFGKYAEAASRDSVEIMQEIYPEIQVDY